jgi:hypothetical protein
VYLGQPRILFALRLIKTRQSAMTEPARRFPASWRPDRIPGGYVVRDAPGQIVAWGYALASAAEAMQAKVLTLDIVRRIATNIGRLPELLRQR